MSTHLKYLGKKLVRANPAITQYKDKYYHTVEAFHSFDSVLDQVARNLELDAWCSETFGYTALSLLPSDTGTYFKFPTKEDAMQFKLAWDGR